MTKTLLCACAVLAATMPLRAIAPAGCEGTPAYSPCEMYFDAPPADAKARADPWSTATIQAEFRGPNYRTYLMPGFWDGQRFVIRFAPTQPGKWIYRISSNIPSFEGKQGSFNTVQSDAPGFLITANV